MMVLQRDLRSICHSSAADGRARFANYTVVVYSNCHCSYAFCLSSTSSSFYVGFSVVLFYFMPS